MKDTNRDITNSPLNKKMNFAVLNILDFIIQKIKAMLKDGCQEPYSVICLTEESRFAVAFFNSLEELQQELLKQPIKSKPFVIDGNKRLSFLKLSLPTLEQELTAKIILLIDVINHYDLPNNKIIIAEEIEVGTAENSDNNKQ